MPRGVATRLPQNTPVLIYKYDQTGIHTILRYHYPFALNNVYLQLLEIPGQYVRLNANWALGWRQI